MHHTKTLHMAVFSTVVALLSGCASSPNMHYSGPMPQASNVAGKTVAIYTYTQGGDVQTGCILALTHKCREATFSHKEINANFGKLLSSAIDKSGGKPVIVKSLSGTGWAIRTQVSPIPGNKYEAIVHYDLGKTMAIGLIPIAGMFTPRYYEIAITMDDHVQILHNGTVAWEQSIPIKVKKAFSASDLVIGNDALHNGSVYRIYRDSQDRAIAQILPALNKVMAQG